MAAGSAGRAREVPQDGALGAPSGNTEGSAEPSQGTQGCWRQDTAALRHTVHAYRQTYPEHLENCLMKQREGIAFCMPTAKSCCSRNKNPGSELQLEDRQIPVLLLKLSPGREDSPRRGRWELATHAKTFQLTPWQETGC